MSAIGHHAALIAAMGSVSYASTILADAPLLFYMLNATSGTTEANLGSVSGAGGSYSGGYTLAQSTGRTGIPSGARFDGSTGFFSTGAITPLTGISAFSIEAWIIPYDITSNSRVSDLNNKISMAFNAGILNLIVNGGVPLSATAPAASPAAAYYILMTGDASGYEIYVNNVLVASNSTAYSLSSTTSNYYIGRYNAGSYFCNMVMAGHALYGYKLSPTQRSAHYAAGL
jgi:hypothetical protein